MHNVVSFLSMKMTVCVNHNPIRRTGPLADLEPVDSSSQSKFYYVPARWPWTVSTIPPHLWASLPARYCCRLIFLQHRFDHVTLLLNTLLLLPFSNRCLQIVMLRKTPESPLHCKEIKLVNPKGNQPWIFIGRTVAEAEAPILWPLDAKNWFIGKVPDAGKD